MSEVIVREEYVTIPTYEIGKYNTNPMFLEKRVYQGSSGRVYPHPVCESISDTKTNKEYKAVFLENDYIEVMILPELGGRIQRLYDKTNGYDAVYYNEVVKPALVGLAGPWISGGIEFNWPQHHRPSTFDPVQYSIERHFDGSITVWVGETEKMFHTRGSAGFTVSPNAAYLKIEGKVYNPTEEPQTFLWWANPAVAVNDHTRSIFPPDVNAVFDHGKRDVSEFPIAKGVYYKVDYAPGTDISRYKNIPVPTSYMAHHSDYDFIGNYDDSLEAGLLHVADHHISPGKKQWTWGNGDFGRAWDRNLTDENGPYIELMTGVFTDNQPDFTFLKPFEEKTFTQYFMPYKKCGAIKNANKTMALNLENEPDGSAVVTLYLSEKINGTLSIQLFNKNGIRLDREISLLPSEYATLCVDDFDTEKEGAGVRVLVDGKELISYTKKTTDIPVPEPAKPMARPEDVGSTEDLFLCGTHLEQYRHATYRPEDYYLEGLKRDKTDIRLNNAYGRLLYKKGRFEESIEYFKAAIKKSTMFNPNPYDCEPFFNLGVAYKRLGRLDEAFDAFYKATWDGNFRGKAFFELALIRSKKKDLKGALELVETSLSEQPGNYKARTLKTAILRHLGDYTDAKTFAAETAAMDALECGARYELSILHDNNIWFTLMRQDAADFIELSLVYEEAGFEDDVIRILDSYMDLAEGTVRTVDSGLMPMVDYRLYNLTGNPKYLKRGEGADFRYCFPNRVDDIPVLRRAVEAGGHKAEYYLGCLLYDKGEWQEAMRLWENCAGFFWLPAVYRNLSLCYYNKLHDGEKALAAMRKAFEEDTDDARVFFELDQLLKTLDVSKEERLKNMEENKKLLETRDDLFTEYISLINDSGDHDRAYELIMGHKFHPWEGGEGKITREYRRALMGKAEGTSDRKLKKEFLISALSYPVNLGEGKLIGELNNDIYWLLAENEENPAEKDNFYSLAARGEDNFSSGMYYNDQPPEMTYYRALALNAVGRKDEARTIGEKMKEYGESHMNDHVTIDYFAVSLPDFLIYECDLDKKNRLHCENMIKLGEGILRDIK